MTKPATLSTQISAKRSVHGKPTAPRLRFVSDPRKAFPGDSAMILTAGVVDSTERYWPEGTVYEPLSAGANAIEGCQTQDVTIDGQRVMFCVRGTK